MVGSRKSLDSEIFQKFFRNLIQKFFKNFQKKIKTLIYRTLLDWKLSILPVIGNQKMLKEATCHYKEERFPYYNSLYRDDLLVKMIIYEYVLELIGNDIYYMELEDLHNYLDEILPK